MVPFVRKIIFAAGELSLLVVLVMFVCAGAYAGDAVVNSVDDVKQPAPPAKKAKTQGSVAAVTVTPKPVRHIWNVQGQADNDKMIIVNDKGDVKVVNIGDEIDGCLVTGDRVVCEQQEKDEINKALVAARNAESKRRADASQEAVTLHKLKHDFDAASAALSEKDDEIKSLSALQEQSKKALAEKEGEADQLKKDLAAIDIAKIKSESAAISLKLSELLKSIAEKDKMLSAMVYEAKGKDIMIQKLKSQLAALESEAALSGQQIAKLKQYEKELAEKTAALEALNRGLSQAKEQAKDADSLYRQIASQYDALAGKVELVDQLKEQVKQYEKTAAAAGEIQKNMKAENAEKDNKIAALAGELTTNGNLVAQLKAEIKSYYSQVKGKDGLVAHTDGNAQRQDLQVAKEQNAAGGAVMRREPTFTTQGFLISLILWHQRGRSSKRLK